MDALRMANAIVHFRILRSLGRFSPTPNPAVYQFHPCLCGRLRAEPLPNGLPEPLGNFKVRQVIEDFTEELGLLCRQHYSRS
jgi:hypothetical protein